MGITPYYVTAMLLSVCVMAALLRQPVPGALLPHPLPPMNE